MFSKKHILSGKTDLNQLSFFRQVCSSFQMKNSSFSHWRDLGMTPLNHRPTPSTNATLPLEDGVKSYNKIQKNNPTLHVETEVNLKIIVCGCKNVKCLCLFCDFISWHKKELKSASQHEISPNTPQERSSKWETWWSWWCALVSFMMELETNN